MNFLAVFVFALALIGVLAAPTPDNSTPPEKKGIIRQIAHSPVVQLTGQALTSCAPGLITMNPVKLAYAGVKCVVKGAASIVDGTRISLHNKEQRKLKEEAKKEQ